MDKMSLYNNSFIQSIDDYQMNYLQTIIDMYSLMNANKFLNGFGSTNTYCDEKDAQTCNINTFPMLQPTDCLTTLNQSSSVLQLENERMSPFSFIKIKSKDYSGMCSYANPEHQRFSSTPNLSLDQVKSSIIKPVPVKVKIGEEQNLETSTSSTRSTEVKPTVDNDSRNMKWNKLINYEALEGHQYEILPNPSAKKGKSNYIYVCKYGNCGKTFTKTWNLVYHFRVHTNEKPFKCKYCNKQFSQKGNLGRHLETHEQGDMENRRVYT